MSHIPLRVWRMLIVAWLLLGADAAPAQLLQEAGSLRGFLAGHAPDCAYDNWISHVSENVARPGYNAYSPTLLDPQQNGFGTCQLLTADAAGDSVLSLFRELTLDLMLGDASGAAARLALQGGRGYQVVQLADSGLQRDFLILREELDSTWTDPGLSPGPQDDVVGSFSRGWGVFVFNPAATHPELVVEVPHPCDDFATPYLGLEALLELDAGLLMINGAGREVAYSGQASAYTNSLSLSDPSRNCRLPFAAVHEAFLAQWRAQGIQELVLQLHGYDDASHRNLTTCVVTAGPSNRVHYPVLFDTGGGSKGLLGNLEQPVFPANSLGWTHGEWRLQDYISSNSSYPVWVDGGRPDSLILVPTAGALPGYGANCQLVASYGTSYAECDNLERFIHVELDELPAPAHAMGAAAFYLSDPDTLVAGWWNFTRAWAFHRPFFLAFEMALDSLSTFTDSEAPSAPGNLSVSQLGTTGARLSWTPTRSVLFDTYEVLVDTAAVVGPTARSITRSSSGSLCWPGLCGVDISGLESGRNHAMAVRALDRRGRISELSNTVTLHVVDSQPPVVLVEERRLALLDEPVELNAQVSDASPLASVLLRWSASQGPWQEQAMTATGGNGFRAVLGPFTEPDTLRYLVEATDAPRGRATAQSDTTTLVLRRLQTVLDFDINAAATHEAFGGRADQWRRESCLSRGGQAWRFGGLACASYSALGAAYLSFDSLVVPVGLEHPLLAVWSRMEAETSTQYPDSCYDGGVLEWSLDGAPWEPVPLVPDYTHALRRGSNVPLAWPRPMLSGSGSWRQLLIPLPEGLGRVALRAGFVSDGATNRGGWALDEVTLAGLPAPELDTPIVEALVVDGVLRLRWLEVPGAASYAVEATSEPWTGVWETIRLQAECSLDFPTEAVDARLFFRVRALTTTP